MAPLHEKYRLLNGEDGESPSSSEDLTSHVRFARCQDSRHRWTSKSVVLVGSLLGAGLATNIILAVLNMRQWTSIHTHEGGNGEWKSPIAGLSHNHPMAWHDHTQYSHPNLSEADRAWVNMDIDYIVVALEKEDAREKGLPDSANFPWDEDYSAYMISSLHSLHCLKSLHRSNLEYRSGVKQSYPTEHLIHCLDNVRQDLVCAADDTPRYIPVGATDSAHTGIGQYRQCKDWAALEKFGREHSACFSYNELETWEIKGEIGYPHALSHCPADSKWLPAVRKFYGKPDDWVPVKPPPPYPAVGVPFDGYESQRNAAEAGLVEHP